MLSVIFLVLGVLGLIITSALALQGERTLSERAQALCNSTVDWFIGVGGMLAFCVLAQWCGLHWWIALFWAGFWGHIWIANKERYRR